MLDGFAENANSERIDDTVRWRRNAVSLDRIRDQWIRLGIGRGVNRTYSSLCDESFWRDRRRRREMVRSIRNMGRPLFNVPTARFLDSICRWYRVHFIDASPPGLASIGKQNEMAMGESSISRRKRRTVSFYVGGCSRFYDLIGERVEKIWRLCRFGLNRRGGML